MSLREIPSAPGYLVDEDGIVYSLLRHRGIPYRLKVYSDRDGYLRFSQSLGQRDKVKRRGVHQAVAEVFLGPCPDGLQVRHLNGDKSDNRPVNLCYGTGSENTQDQIRHGVHIYGSRTACSKGHEYTPENTYHYTHRFGGPARRCRICDRATAVRKRQRAHSRKEAA